MRASFVSSAALFTGTIALVALVGCSSTNAAGAGGSATTSTGDANPQTVTGTGTGTGTTNPTSTVSTGTGTTGDTYTIQLGQFDIPPGGEVYKCQNFANPFGKDVDVKAFESHMTAGSHHLLLFYKNGVDKDGPLEDCSGLEFSATPYGTQQPDDTLEFPAGVAAALPASTGLRLQAHYLNVTSSTVTANVSVTFHLADPTTVTDEAGVMFVPQLDIHVPPNSQKTITYDCNVPVDMHVMKASSHMHKHGTTFHSTVAGKTLYDTDTWDEPAPELFSPTLDVKAGDPLHFECTFVNDTANELTFGESAQTNEMCILTASFYPTPKGYPTITCQ